MATRRATQEARDLLANKVERAGPGWRNAALGIKSGSWGNCWTEAALAAIDEAFNQGRDDSPPA